MTDERHDGVEPQHGDGGHGSPSPAADTAVPEAPPLDAEELLARVQDAERERDKNLDDLRRVAADFDNYRKRVVREQAQLYARAGERVVAKLLPVLDDLERALDAAEHHEEAKVLEGVRMTKDALAGLLAAEGVEEIATDGLFDPHVHEALHDPARRGGRARPRRAGRAARLPAGRRRAAPRARHRRRGVTVAPRDPYAVLGVPKTATDDELKKAYRKLARELHPDRNPDDPSAEERFKDVQAAYDILSDAEKRQAYDRFGANGPGPQGGFGPGGVALRERRPRRPLRPARELRLLLRARSGARRRPQPERGADYESRVRISFEDALEGVQVRVPIEVETACHVCGGSGAEPGTAPRTCPDCQGSGVIADSQGLFALSHPCPRCRGNGVVVDTPCKNCRGSGRERVTRRYQVKVPAGAKDGTRIRLKGKGEPGRNGGPAGDLFVRVEVEPSPLYERRGADLVLEVPVTYPEAALGATVEIPTPQGPVGLKVPSGSESGKLLRVKGRGAPKLKGGGKGDLLARLKVTVPSKLSKAEREALEAYQRSSREQPRDHMSRTVVLFPAMPSGLDVAASLEGHRCLTVRAT